MVQVNENKNPACTAERTELYSRSEIGWFGSCSSKDKNSKRSRRSLEVLHVFSSNQRESHQQQLFLSLFSSCQGGQDRVAPGERRRPSNSAARYANELPNDRRHLAAAN